ncbi:MAG: hypothetical protein K9L78_03940 [Victivallales bacterium]|nr:hypothetical protein [Victivallales bacterium]MCF7889252.1 hypothetical protein [Victivallales bacterium]
MSEIIKLSSYRDVECYFEQLKINGFFCIAIDIECEMNLHCYGEHLCLIQLFSGNEKIIIDPFDFQSQQELLDVLKAVFENRKILKISYDAAGDASVIEKLYGIKFKSIMDLKPAVELLNYEKQGLSDVLEKELNIPPLPKKKFQTYNWMKRPISPEALEYAMCDVIYLFDLKNILMDKIIKKKLLDNYMLLNISLQNREFHKSGPEDIYRKRKGYSRLSKNGKKIFRDIYDLREKYAEKVNRAPNFLLSNDKIIILSKRKIDPDSYFEKFVTHRLPVKTRMEFINELTDLYSKNCF